jgi:hypothetical protein
MQSPAWRHDLGLVAIGTDACDCEPTAGVAPWLVLALELQNRTATNHQCEVGILCFLNTGGAVQKSSMVQDYIPLSSDLPEARAKRRSPESKTT